MRFPSGSYTFEKMMEEMTGNVRRACKEMIEVSLDEAVGIMEERMTA